MNENTPHKLQRITVIPIGRPSLEQVHSLCDRLEQVFNRVQCCILKGLPIPEESFNRQMKAYAAKGILNFLGDTCSCGADEKILGTTDVDLCLPDSDLPRYLFGLASRPRSIAVISTYRLQSQCPEDNRNSLLAERMTKEAMHELGHLIGLSHCHNPACIMTVSKSAQAIDKKRLEYCLKCREHASFHIDDGVLNWIKPVI